ncbi:hypothetical protein SLEP1_g2021 [Rubroshorea leprosula]|uniref:Uncharacterized protein n=1 Tax=Rubroshorea leprosula TaxID=152421 RepID=A0AAV5HPH5_9ROSI|nr:hypothetical protein SLEP1_g2021 [Rubroshorea leprosula]
MPMISSSLLEYCNVVCEIREALVENKIMNGAEKKTKRLQLLGMALPRKLRNVDLRWNFNISRRGQQ